MRKRRFYLLWIAMALALAAVLIWAISPSEPSYEGKRLSEWVHDFETPETAVGLRERDVAIRKIGTNAIPHLLKWIAYKPPAWKTFFYRAGDSVLGQLNSNWELPDCSRSLRANAAFRALLLLGTNADCALPELEKIFNAKDSPFDLARAAHVRCAGSFDGAFFDLTYGSTNVVSPAIDRLLDTYVLSRFFSVIQPGLTNETLSRRLWATNLLRKVERLLSETPQHSAP
jgi:hypothetical protein